MALSPGRARKPVARQRKRRTMRRYLSQRSWPMMALIGGLILGVVPALPVLGAETCRLLGKSRSPSRRQFLASVVAVSLPAVRHLWRWRRYDLRRLLKAMRFGTGSVPECMVYWFYGAGCMVRFSASLFGLLSSGLPSSMTTKLVLTALTVCRDISGRGIPPRAAGDAVAARRFWARRSRWRYGVAADAGGIPCAWLGLTRRGYWSALRPRACATFRAPGAG